LSHCLLLERPKDVVFIVLNCPAEHPIKD